MRKERKPYVTCKTAGGKDRWYYRLTWTEDGKQKDRYIPLSGEPGSIEFDRSYWAIRSGESPAVKPQEKETWRELVTAYRSSAKFKKLAPRTRKSYNDTIEWILAANASKPVIRLTKQKLREMHVKYADTPRKADMLVQIVSILTNFARKTLDWTIPNPAEGLDLYGKQREYEPWPDWLVSKLVDAPLTVRSAAELILGTGQRPAAAIAMRRDQFRGIWMTVTDEKGDESYDIYCPVPLRDYLAALPIEGQHIIPRNLTQPLKYDAVEKAFRSWRADLGGRAKPYSLHGLRKLAIVRLAEAGCTDAEIQAITNQSPQTVAYYRKRANRKKLSRNAMERDENKT
ncbi:tyrosine-type recombinase/integrase [Paracoccus methylovorus]|uniref:Tyrosine-type recombinase/integrase n=1 Tax=Paracoccus methylovorus TaxID=2812658 RepID=A0ABX7JMG6_9RHOB|nr:tyrosine-type recombinase/integrase [Paracoccus methylovorus]QRZ14686.1 tyrosine-type recombinase/integrase [Paracoccus methylovorus]